MSEAQGSAPAPAAPQSTQSQTQPTQPSGRLVDANKPTVKGELNRVEDKLNPKGANEQKQQPGETDAQYAKRMYKVKIEGKELEVDEDELIRGYQVRKVSEKYRREGEAAKKQAEEFVRLLKEDPIRLLKDPRIGHDVRKLAEEYLAGQLKDEMMDPKERELRDAKAKIKQFEDFEKKQKEEQELQKKEILRKKFTENYTQDIVKALDTSGLPRKPETVKRIANKMALALKIGENITASEATQLVKEDLIEESKSIYSASPAETLASLLGEENLKKIREWDISRLKSGQSPRPPKVENPTEIENKKATPSSFQERRKRIRGF